MKGHAPRRCSRPSAGRRRIKQRRHVWQAEVKIILGIRAQVDNVGHQVLKGSLFVVVCRGGVADAYREVAAQVLLCPRGVAAVALLPGRKARHRHAPPLRRAGLPHLLLKLRRKRGRAQACRCRPQPDPLCGTCAGRHAGHAHRQLPRWTAVQISHAALRVPTQLPLQPTRASARHSRAC